MNPGPSEEAGQTARSFIDAMKTQPALLAMVIANILILGFVYFVQISNNKAWGEVNAYRVEVGKAVLDYNKEVSMLLAQCSIVPKPPQ